MVVNNSDMSQEIELYRLLDRAAVFTNGAHNVLAMQDKLVNRERVVQQIVTIKGTLEHIDNEMARIDGKSTPLA
jgi:hypothetical protein